MTLLVGKLADIRVEEGMRIGKVRVKGAVEEVQLLLTPVAKVGDDVLIDSGVAVAIVNDKQIEEEKNVPGHTGKSR